MIKMTGQQRLKRVNIQSDRVIACCLYLATCLGCVPNPQILKLDASEATSDLSIASGERQFRPTELPQGNAPLEAGSLQHQEIDVVVLCMVGPPLSRRVRLVFGRYVPEANTFEPAINVGGPIHTAEAIRRLHVLAKEWRQPFGVLLTVHDKHWQVAAGQEPVVVTQVADIITGLRSAGLSFRQIEPGPDFTWQGYFMLH